ncbi:MAG: M24 family metallopeptidase [Burkholderiales bacterium]
MRTMQPVTVFGSYMLDEEQIPPDEFELRVSAAQNVMKQNGWSGLIAYGDAEDNAFVTYSTNYSPRNRTALALVGPTGVPRLICWAGLRDIKREAALAWMDDVKMAGNLGDTLQTWFKDAGIAAGTVGLVDEGAMKPQVHDAIIGSLASSGLTAANADAAIVELMHKKRPRELVVVCRAAEILGKTFDTLAASWRSGASATDAVLAAEGTAFANAAQDARTLFSINEGRTIRPFDRPLQDHPERFVVYAAVRYQGYWAEGFVTLSRRRNAIQKAAAQALDQMIAAACPGATGDDLARAIAEATQGFTPHAALTGSLAHGIGLSLHEAPDLAPNKPGAMVAEGTYSLTVGLSQGKNHHAFASAMISLADGKTAVLWRAP